MERSDCGNPGMKGDCGSSGFGLVLEKAHQIVGVDDAGNRREECGLSFDLGFQGLAFTRAQHFKLFNPVFPAAFKEVGQIFLFVSGGRDYDFA